MFFNIEKIEDILKIESVPFSQRFDPCSTYELIKRSAQRFPDNPAIRYLDSADIIEDEAFVFTYSEFLYSLHQTANLFSRLGIAKSDVVSYLLPNLPQTHMTIWGGEIAGIVNPINPMLDASVIADIMNEAGTRVLVALGPAPGTDIWSKVELVAAKVKSLKAILRVDPGALRGLSTLPALDDGSALAGVPVLDFDQARLKEQGDNMSLVSERRPEDIASYFHTGGTTGQPKIAQHSHLNETANASIFSAIVARDEPLNFFVGLPLFHVNAVVGTGLGVFANGGCVTLLTSQGYRNPAVHKNFWKLVEKYKATHFSCVPTVLTSLLSTSVEESDISSLDFAICGAAPLSTALFEAFERQFNIKILEGYGLTEGTCVSSLNPPNGLRRIGSVGMRLPYQSMKAVVVDADGKYLRDCKVDEVGVIVIRGPNVFPGYKQAESNARIFVYDDWLSTGDMGRQDAEGYFWLTGRAKDLIIRGGHNIDPSVIESSLAKHAAVAEVAAIGQPDSYAGELPCAYVTLKPGCSLTVNDLLEYARINIHERAAIPVCIEIIEDMPLTGVGKIFKPALRLMATERVLGAVLADADIEATLSAHNDASRGLVVSIRSESPRTLLEKALEQFAITIDIDAAGS